MTAVMAAKETDVTLEQLLEYLEHVNELDGRQKLDDVKLADRMVEAATILTSRIVKKAQQARGSVTADRIHLTNRSMRDVAAEVDRSHNALGTYWLGKDGPQKYVTVRKDGTEFFLEAVKPQALRYLTGVERRVAPSVWGLYDNETNSITWEGTAEQLWDKLPELPALD